MTVSWALVYQQTGMRLQVLNKTDIMDIFPLSFKNLPLPVHSSTYCCLFLDIAKKLLENYEHKTVKIMCLLNIYKTVILVDWRCVIDSEFCWHVTIGFTWMKVFFTIQSLEMRLIITFHHGNIFSALIMVTSVATLGCSTDLHLEVLHLPHQLAKLSFNWFIHHKIGSASKITLPITFCNHHYI